MSAVAGAHRVVTRPGSLVLSIANDREQARLALEYAKSVMTSDRLLLAMLDGLRRTRIRSRPLVIRRRAIEPDRARRSALVGDLDGRRPGWSSLVDQ
jgi:hypothetical protein